MIINDHKCSPRLQDSTSRCRNFLKTTWLASSQLCRRSIWSCSPRWLPPPPPPKPLQVGAAQTSGKPSQNILGKLRFNWWCSMLRWPLGPQKSPRSHFQVYPIYPCSSCVDVSWCTSLIFALENNTHFKPPAAIQLVFLWPSPWNKAVWLTVVATGPSAWTGCPWSPWCRAKSTSFLMVSWIASMMLWSRVTLCWSKALWPSTAWKDCKRGTGKLQSATSAHLIWDRQDNQIGLSEEHLLKLSTAKTSAPHGFKPARNADSHLDCIFFEYFNFACSEVEEYLHVFPL